MAAYIDQRDIIFGVTVSGRNIDIDGIENMVGTFVKTLPLRITFSDSSKVMEVLHTYNNMVMEIESHKDIDMVHLADFLHRIIIEIFSVVVVVQNYPVDKSLYNHKSNNISFKLYSSSYEPDAEVVVGVKTFGEHSNVEIYYNQSLYSEDYIKLLCQNIHSVTAQIIKNHNLKELTIDKIDVVKHQVNSHISEDIGRLDDLKFNS